MTIRTLILLAATISLCLSVQIAVGQSVGDQGNLSRIFDTDPELQEIAKKLEIKLKELEDARIRLNSAGGRMEVESSPLVEKPIPGVPDDNSRLKDNEATREIQQSIELMKKFMEKKLDGHPIDGSGSPPTNTIPAAMAGPNSIPDLKPSINEMLNSGAADSPGEGDFPKGQPSQVTAAERVLPSPVNTFEMANSLFQTGNPAAALDAYHAVERDKISAFDSLWLDYMIACCNRHLGNLDDAETGYRQIANEKQRLHPVDESMHWLKYLGTSRTTKNLYKQLDMEIESLLNRAQSHVAK